MEQPYGASGLVTASHPAPHLLQLALNRPPFSTALWKELGRNFRKVKFDPDVRAVVMCSEGKFFTAGLDLRDSDVDFRSHDPARTAILMRNHVLEIQSCISAIEECDRPTIAAISGVCYGLGVDIISACDIRLATPSTRFSIKEVDVGLAADVGTLQRLPKATGNASLIRELCFTAREFGVEEAVECGILARGQVVEGGRNEVVKRAVELASEIASKSPVATYATKHLLNYSRDHSVREGLEYTALWNASALQADDVPISMAAVLSKKKPTFKGMSKL